MKLRTSTAVATGMLTVAAAGATVLTVGLIQGWGFPEEPVQPTSQAAEVHEAWTACLSIGYEFDVWESEDGTLKYLCSQVFSTEG